MEKKAIFITGTDTGVGKTLVTGLLARYLSVKGINVITQKWVQTGCLDMSEDVFDHLKIMAKDPNEFKDKMQDMAPQIFKHPASPHLAANMEGLKVDEALIKSSFGRLKYAFDAVIVEGSGGIMVPLSNDRLILDLVQELSLQVLIVAENRLGAINQTLLTVEALKTRGLDIAGIIFNRLSANGDETVLEDNKRIVSKFSGIEVLGELPYSKDIEDLYKNFQAIGEQILSTF